MKRSAGGVLKKRCSWKFRKIHRNSHFAQFLRSFFYSRLPVAVHLDGCTSRHSDPFLSRAKLNWTYCQPLKATRKGKKITKIRVSLKNVRLTLFGVLMLKKESAIFQNTWNRFFLVIIWLKVTFTFPITTIESIYSSNFFFINPRRFYIKRNNNKIVSIETGRTVIADLLLWSESEMCMYATLF